MTYIGISIGIDIQIDMTAIDMVIETVIEMAIFKVIASGISKLRSVVPRYDNLQAIRITMWCSFIHRDHDRH